jgi:hypothetical protein
MGLPHKFPNSVKREPSGEVCILEGQVWKLNVDKIFVVIRGTYPDEKKVAFHHFQYPKVLQETLSEALFRNNFTLWDLVPE